MNDVAMEIIKQLAEELQATRNALIESEERRNRSNEDASMWYKLYQEAKKKLETELPDMEDLNNGNL